MEATTILEIGREVIISEGRAILESALDLENNGFVDVINILRQCRGHVILCGVGKSGHICRKIAASLSSTGTPSFFLHPVEAKHGDLGMITEQDIVIAISYSGESEEILSLIPFIRNKQVKLISITGNKNSNLARSSDKSVILKAEKEACPHNLAPTVSTSVTLALGDALAITLMELKNFTRDDFSKNHPSGKLGKILLTKINEVMSKLDGIPTVVVDDSLQNAINVITEKRLGFTAVINEARHPIGIITDGDLRRALLKYTDIRNILVSQIMTYNPKVINQNILAVDAFKYLQQNKITSLLVVDEFDTLIGATHIHDLIKMGLSY